MTVQSPNELGARLGKAPELDLVRVSVDERRLAVLRELERRHLAWDRRTETPGKEPTVRRSVRAMHGPETGGGERWGGRTRACADLQHPSLPT